MHFRIFNCALWRILQLLQFDARLSNKEIADKIGKTVSPVDERINCLSNWLNKTDFISESKMRFSNIFGYKIL